MSHHTLAAQLFTVRDLLQNKNATQIKGVLQAIKDMGYEAVQISAVGEITPELAATYRSVCTDLGLQICLSHADFTWLQEQLDWVIDYHHQWDCAYVGIGCMPAAYRTSAEGYREFISICNGIAQKLSDSGLTLFYHNHQFEFVRFGAQSGMELLFQGFSRQVEFVLDTCWVQAGGASPAAWIERLSSRINALHYKDYKICYCGNQPELCLTELGSGNLNWPAIIRASKQFAIRYIVVEQDTCAGNPLDSLRQSIQFLRRYF